jgi:hypothetical protein
VTASGLVPRLPNTLVMVDVIVRFTVIAVLALGALNALHGAAVLVRIVRRLAARPDFGLGLWLPAFSSVDDLKTWLGEWRAAFRDPALVALRTDARTVVGRHLYLALMSQTWAVAVTALAPHLA